MLNIGASALAAQQLAMDVTSQNLANATTPGYQEEVTNLTEAPAIPFGGTNAANGPSQLGEGVTVQSVMRVSNAFLARSVRAETSLANTWSTVSQALQQLEPLFQEPSSTGLGEAMDAFFGAWQTLSQNPTSISARTALLGQAQQLTSTFQSLSGQLLQEQTNLNQNVQSEVGQVNALAQQIANLNQSIEAVGPSGNPNDLLDQRGELLNQLAQLVNITYTSTPSGALYVYVGSHVLVANTQTYQLTTVQDPSTGLWDVQWADGSAAYIQSGTLYGTLEVRGQTQNGTFSGYIPTYLSQLNTLAAGLANAVNQLQASGYGLNGTTPTNIPFFTSGSAPSITAGNITVNPVLVANPTDIAAASSPSSPGDGSNALAIADLAQSNSITYPGQTVTGTFNDYWSALVGTVGLDGQSANARQQSTQSTLQDMQNALQSQVGVNPDQESVNLIQEEQSYRAAVQVITTEQSSMSALLAAIA
jgi:flagellar hook-associated protein 1 FlgK